MAEIKDASRAAPAPGPLVNGKSASEAAAQAPASSVLFTLLSAN